jgi:hypothetical protein
MIGCLIRVGSRSSPKLTAADLVKFNVTRGTQSILASVLLHSDPSDLMVRAFGMTFAKFLLVAFLVFAGVHASSAAVRIAGDRGGRIGKYLDRYDAIRTSGETVVIDGYARQLAPWFSAPFRTTKSA